MPTPMLLKISKKRKIPIKKVEEYWEKAKELAKDKFGEDHKAYWPYVTGIVKHMTGYAQKASKGITASELVPGRVKVAINRQIYTVLKPIFARIMNGESLPRGMACHALSFKYLLTHDDPNLKQVMLYKFNNIDREASLLAHSVICKGNTIVYDSLGSSVKEIVDDIYYDSNTKETLVVGVRLSLNVIEQLVQ